MSDKRELNYMHGSEREFVAHSLKSEKETEACILTNMLNKMSLPRNFQGKTKHAVNHVKFRENIRLDCTHIDFGYSLLQPNHIAVLPSAPR